LRRAKVGVPRSELPPRDDKDFYRADLIGCEVVNLAGVGSGPWRISSRYRRRCLDGGARRTGILGAGRPAAFAAGGSAARQVVVDWDEAAGWRAQLARPG
jgi:hypothetical protein